MSSMIDSKYVDMKAKKRSADNFKALLIMEVETFVLQH